MPDILSSVKSQDFFNYEIIVADADSTDNTRRIAEQFGVKIVAGGLPARGRNNGARESRGEVLLFLDADVILPDGFLKNSLREFKERNLGVASCFAKPFGGKAMDKFLYKSVDVYFKLTEDFFPHSTGICIFAKREVHDVLGGFDENIKLAEDHNYACRARKITKFGYLKLVVYNKVRRLETDGRLKIGVKYTLCELHRIFLGEVKSNIFNYKFNHYKKDKRIKSYDDNNSPKRWG